MNRKKLFDHSTAVMAAEVVGYFYNYGKRYDKCRHTSCGFERLRDSTCWYKRNKYKAKEHKKCWDDWCVDRYGSRPNELPVAKSVKFKKTYFRAYTREELAIPTTKVELVAVKVRVAQRWYPPSGDNVAIYNLLEDKWYSNNWWSLTPKGDVAPNSRSNLSVAPNAVAGMNDVIAKVKAGI